MTWATVGSPSFGAANSGALAVAVNPTSTSNIMLLAVLAGASGATPSGGGVTSWVNCDAGGVAGNQIAIWAGKITSTGPSTITIPTSGSSVGAWAQELSGGGVPTLDIDGNANYTSTLSGNYPALVPNFANEIYLACASLQSYPPTPGPGGSSPGFTYFNGQGLFGSRTFWMQVVLELNVNGPTSYSPAWTCPGGGGGFHQVLFDCLLYVPAPVSKIVMIL